MIMEKYKCTNCTDEVTDIIIECGECKKMYLCLECFSCGAEIGKHKKDHKYRVQQLRSIFGDNDGWTTKEDVKLLYGCLEFGPCWDKITQKLPSRTAEEIKAHYVKNFLESEFAKRIKSPSAIPLLKQYEPKDDDVFINLTANRVNRMKRNCPAPPESDNATSSSSSTEEEEKQEEMETKE